MAGRLPAPRGGIIAPAIPYYGRVTRGGIQMLRTEAGEHPVGARLAEDLGP